MKMIDNLKKQIDFFHIDLDEFIQLWDESFTAVNKVKIISDFLGKRYSRRELMDYMDYKWNDLPFKETLKDKLQSLKKVTKNFLCGRYWVIDIEVRPILWIAFWDHLSTEEREVLLHIFKEKFEFKDSDIKKYANLLWNDLIKMKTLNSKLDHLIKTIGQFKQTLLFNEHPLILLRGDKYHDLEHYRIEKMNKSPKISMISRKLSKKTNKRFEVPLNMKQIKLKTGTYKISQIKEEFEETEKYLEREENKYKEALVKFLIQEKGYKEREIENIKREDWDHFGLYVFSINNKEYSIGTDGECNRAVHECIVNSVWAFKSWFLANYLEVETEVVEKVQKACSEDCNDLFVEFLEAKEVLNEFVGDAVRSDGRGHFLSQYDSNEYEIEYNKEIYYIYRLN